jgi:predicted PurR-regulated permease PerM
VLGLILGPVVVAVTLALIEMVRQTGQAPIDTLTRPTVIEEQSELREEDGPDRSAR